MPGEAEIGLRAEMAAEIVGAAGVLAVVDVGVVAVDVLEVGAGIAGAVDVRGVVVAEGGTRNLFATDLHGSHGWNQSDKSRKIAERLRSFLFGRLLGPGGLWERIESGFFGSRGIGQNSFAQAPSWVRVHFLLVRRKLFRVERVAGATRVLFRLQHLL